MDAAMLHQIHCVVEEEKKSIYAPMSPRKRKTSLFSESTKSPIHKAKSPKIKLSEVGVFFICFTILYDIYFTQRSDRKYKNEEKHDEVM